MVRRRIRWRNHGYPQATVELTQEEFLEMLNGPKLLSFHKTSRENAIRLIIYEEDSRFISFV